MASGKIEINLSLKDNYSFFMYNMFKISDIQKKGYGYVIFNYSEGLDFAIEYAKRKIHNLIDKM